MAKPKPVLPGRQMQKKPQGGGTKRVGGPPLPIPRGVKPKPMPRGMTPVAMYKAPKAAGPANRLSKNKVR